MQEKNSALLMQTLDPLTLPLRGRILIEASAGTGKTYTLVQLYLRLILGLSDPHPPLSVEQILVVTFTEAATQELRNRIRDSLHALRLACDANESNSDPLFSLIQDKQDAAMRLLVAEQQMDQAAIYTIHGFCQRMLIANAFDAHLPFTQHFITNEDALIQQAATDFWRCYFYPLSPSLIDVLHSYWKEPNALLTEIYPYLTGELPRAFSSILACQPEQFADTFQHYYAQNVQRIQHIKQLWQENAAQLDAIITASGVDKRSYSTKNLPNWLNQVADWVDDETQIALYPRVLAKFSQQTFIEKTKKGEPPTHSLFQQIDELIAQYCDIKTQLLPLIIVTLRQRIAHKKRQLNRCGFDDLLLQLDAALNFPETGAALAQKIAAHYPVAMVDEFQDTDPIQYRIFDRLYPRGADHTLLFIGDPKQAIYAFRGADIFTYIAAKNSCDAIYTMETNWRSAPSMINIVNQLFSRNANAFMFEQIPFMPVRAAEKNSALTFYLYGEKQNALQSYLLPNERVNATKYREQIADICAKRILQLLRAAADYHAWLNNETVCRVLEAKDIAILVRSKSEASAIKAALNAYHIPSVYLSNRETVFDTHEARDVYHILRAVLMPENAGFIRTALASALFDLPLATIDELNVDEQKWETVVEQFNHYRTIWFERSVFSVISQIMEDYQLAATLLAYENGERRLTDVMHLAELLQEAQYQQDSPHALLRWFLDNLQEQKVTQDNQQQRLESDRHLVQIITIHKSKGLEYPIVFLPFESYFKETKSRIYHDRTQFHRVFAASPNEQEQTWIEEERLSEDLRLFYVGITRAMYHCEIGLAAFVADNKKTTSTDVHRSAIGALLQRQNVGELADLHAAITEIDEGDVMVVDVETESQAPLTQTESQPSLQASHFSRELRYFWKITSYSHLTHHQSNQYIEWDKIESVQENTEINAISPSNESVLSAFTFPKGALAGTVLHTLLENYLHIDGPDSPVLQDGLARLWLDASWQNVTLNWLQNIVKTPLNAASDLTLEHVFQGQFLIEFPFYLSVKHCISAAALNQLCRQYDPLSARCDALRFEQFEGMLKGFVDLIFEWQGQFYIVDYKSNWLGEKESDYSPQNMANAMCEHRYDLQYQIYTLALHRYLKTRIVDYDYDVHFAGVYYLFLRGMTGENADHGVYFYRPEKPFILAFDALLEGE